ARAPEIPEGRRGRAARRAPHGDRPRSGAPRRRVHVRLRRAAPPRPPAGAGRDGAVRRAPRPVAPRGAAARRALSVGDGAARRGGKGAVPLRGSSLLARPAPPFAAASRPRGSVVSEAIAAYGALMTEEPEPRVAAYASPDPSPSPVGGLTLLGQYRDSFLV